MAATLHSLLTGKRVKTQFSVLVIGDTSSLGPAETDVKASGGAESGAEVLNGFIKEIIPAPQLTILPPKLMSKEKAVAKLNSFLINTEATISLVVYIGPADQHGNWIFKNDETLAFSEVSAMWNKVRKHSQRLVLVIDAPNGGSWVKQLRGLNRMDQLDLSMCIQASYSTQDNLHIPVNHVPGDFLKAFIQYNRTEQAPPSHMFATYHSTWLGESLVDFGSSLRFLSSLTSEKSSSLRPTSMGSTEPSISKGNSIRCVSHMPEASGSSREKALLKDSEFQHVHNKLRQHSISVHDSSSQSSFAVQLTDMLNQELKRQARLAKRFEVKGGQVIDEILESRDPEGDSDGERMGRIKEASAGDLQLLAPSVRPEEVAIRAIAGAQDTSAIPLGASSMGFLSVGGAARAYGLTDPNQTSEACVDRPKSDGAFVAARGASVAPVVPPSMLEAAERTAGGGKSHPVAGMLMGRSSATPPSNMLLRRLLDPDYSFSRSDSCDGTPPMSPSVRRPRRFEVDGGDRSSFLFADRPDLLDIADGTNVDVQTLLDEELLTMRPASLGSMRPESSQ